MNGTIVVPISKDHHPGIVEDVELNTMQCVWGSMKTVQFMSTLLFVKENVT